MHAWVLVFRGRTRKGAQRKQAVDFCVFPTHENNLNLIFLIKQLCSQQLFYFIMSCFPANYSMPYQVTMCKLMNYSENTLLHLLIESLLETELKSLYNTNINLG
jgi:hypothetical protein